MYGNTLMSNPQTQISKYERIPEVGSGTPANTEGWALLEAAKRLASTIMHGEETDEKNTNARKTALRLNWRLWTIFQAELSSEDGPVPDDIRLNMLTLCKFVDKHSVGCLANPTADRIRVLIDINRNIAAGLLQIAEDDEVAQSGDNGTPENPQVPRGRLETEA